MLTLPKKSYIIKWYNRKDYTIITILNLLQNFTYIIDLEKTNYPQSKDSLDFPCYQDAKLQLTKDEMEKG